MAKIRFLCPLITIFRLQYPDEEEEEEKEEVEEKEEEEEEHDES